MVEPSRGPVGDRAGMNFDRLAPHYGWMEILFAGGLMQRCRVTFLPRVKNCRRALLAGEGTGRFLAELLRFNPDIEVTCLEHCAGMIEQARQRLVHEGLDPARVEFRQVDLLQWTPPAGQFDLVVTNFFLDCFRADQLQPLIPRLACGTTADAIWLLADFRLPERGWRRTRAMMLLAGLYAFFRLTTSLSAHRLTPPDQFLAGAGFKLADRRLASFGFAHADLWKRGT